MKKLTFLIAIATVLCVASVYAGKVKQVGQWTLNNETLQSYDFNKKGMLLVVDQETNAAGKVFVTLHVKDKKFGPFEVVAAAGADSVYIQEPLKLKTFMLRVEKGNNYTFYIFSIGKTLKELGKFETDTNNKCSPIMYYMSGKFYFKQRHEEGEPEHVRLAMFDSKLNNKFDELVQTSDDGCVRYSPNYKYVTVCAAVDGSGNSSLQLYKTGSKLTKLTATDVKSLSANFDFYGKTSKIVEHQKSYDSTTGKRTYEIAKIGSYKPQFDLETDASVASWFIDDKGNVLIVYTNNTVSVVTKKGKTGPFAIPATIVPADCLIVEQFANNKVLIKIRKDNGASDSTMYFVLYSISKKGLKEKGKTSESPNNCPDFCDKYLYTFDYDSNTDTYSLKVYNTSSLKEVGTGVTGASSEFPSFHCFGKYIHITARTGTAPNISYINRIYTINNLKFIGEVASTTFPYLDERCLMISTISGNQQTFTLHSW